ncbi:class I SAM-dependent methyltransferase [Phycisphaerales bacterium AB-hyl4]|uniref:Class I SAM-dependent methyltransferase n=1 Tax=Natronomicrosphaera hydrolytica TaxID=3242702 RepID=A0ABV4U8Z7_9BACT
MKTRESGMPDDASWQTYFSPDATLRAMGLHADTGDVVDFGCGYGTFAIPAARIIKGSVYALDIEADMVAATQAKADAEGVANVLAIRRNFVTEGTGLDDGQAGFAMLFNILHCEEPERLLAEAWRVLRAGGVLGIMHWRCDIPTPRGPSMAIRPRPEQCQQWAEQVGFKANERTVLGLPPYHYGLAMIKQ